MEMLSAHLSCLMMQMSSAQEKAQPLKWCMFSLDIKIQQKASNTALCVALWWMIKKNKTKADFNNNLQENLSNMCRKLQTELEY